MVYWLLTFDPCQFPIWYPFLICQLMSRGVHFGNGASSDQSWVSPRWGNNSEIEHYSDVIMSAMAFQFTGVTIVYSTVCSGVDRRKHQSCASLAFRRGSQRWPLNSPLEGPVTRNMFHFMTSPWHWDTLTDRGKTELSVPEHNTRRTMCTHFTFTEVGTRATSDDTFSQINRRSCVCNHSKTSHKPMNRYCL